MRGKSAGLLFREAVKSSRPLQVLGAVNAYSAVLAKEAGVKALYLSGSGAATASHGLPDLGVTNLNDICDDIRRITLAVPDRPLLVDVDTGFGNALGIARCVQHLCKAGAAAMHIEDQESAKRCGHRPGKQIVSESEMVDRLKAAISTRDECDQDFVIMARTDAFQTEGMDGLLRRCDAYIRQGSDMLFPEAVYTLEDYHTLHSKFPETPILANITEFGKTPLFTASELADAGVSLVLYPLSAHRAMAKAAQTVYRTILEDGTQANCVDLMQTREELYTTLDYHKYERMMDDLYGSEGGSK